MSDSTNRFYSSIDGAATLSQADLTDLFVYYITVESGEPEATPKRVRECFEACDLKVPTRISTHLSEGKKRKKARPAKFIKTKIGYRLERNFKDKLAARLGVERIVVQTSLELRQLEASFPEGPEKEFLKETIDCFEAGADRATIVMCWILILDHLFHFILKHKLNEFNSALAKNTDKRVKVTVINDRYF